ncbi:MAG: hypothetical protein EOP85_09085 [Verrucomicrobiaceae bacterium]|nr:MAG: hypothetical protein EOP85_09085 [Verrucomicrobiaceae bacterium]
MFSGLASAAGDLWPPVDLPKSAAVVQVRVEYIEVPHETFTRLMFLKPAGSNDDSVMREKLQEMVVRNEAKVVETLLLACQSGSKATVESIRELIYPCEYPGGWVCGPPLPEPASDSIFPLVPTAFDTRNCGGTMEIEPIVSGDGKSVQLTVIPDLVSHSGNTVVQEGKAALGNPVTTLMPDFHAARVHVKMNCPVGQHVLAGVLSPPDANGKTDMTRKLLVMVRCDILTVK